MTRHRRRSAALALGAAAVAVVGLLPPSPASGGTGLTVGEAVATALADAAGPDAVADDSSGNAPCMSAGPEAVAYRTDQIVLRTSLPAGTAMARVQAALPQVQAQAQVTHAEVIEFPGPDGEELTPVVAVHFTTTSEEPVPVVRLARRLREGGDRASPNYLLSMEDGPIAMWPGEPPTRTDQPAAGRSTGTGAGTTVVLYDVGVPSPLHSEHPPNLTRLTPADIEHLDTMEPIGEADHYYTGHAVSMADIINTMAPGVAVTVARITGDDGVATDITAARRMASTLRQANAQGSWPPVIVNAFGTAVCDGVLPGEEMVPLGLELVAEAVDRHDQAVVAASSGNRNSSRPFYPAAFDFPTMIAVGALDTSGDGHAWTSDSRTGPRAWFSNYGTWVDAWDSGVRLASRHVKGLRFEPGARKIDGLAYVGGTSYAAPKLAAMIGEVMATNRVDAWTAWLLIAKSGTRCSEAVGGGVAVTLVSLGSTATTPATGTSPAQC
jgi:hypothetical protein